MYRYEEPIFRLRSSSYGSNYWVFHSRKLRRRVAVFSNLEYENILTLEMNPDVEWYCEYPLETTVYIGGKESKVLFNAWVKYKDGTEEYQGVAYLCSSDDSKDHVKVACQSAWCLQNDVNFVFRNEKNIETGPFYIRNISLLAARARRFTACGLNADRIFLSFIQAKRHICIGELEKMGRLEKYRALDYISDLYYRGLVTLSNMNTDCISADTEVISIG